MPQYKKKRHSRIFNPPPKKKAAAPAKRADNGEEIKMTSAKPQKVKQKRDNMRVVKGKKLERNRKLKILAAVIGVFLVAVIIFETILPAGIIQTVSNLTALIGTGSYPISLSGSQTITVESMDSYYFCVSDTHFSAYSNAGKILFNDPHEFENPVLATSEGRVMLYNLGGNQAYIYDLRERKDTIETKFEIVCGDISASGNFALVTYSEKYASAVNVYDDDCNIIYEWYSAENTVNNVAFSSDGERIAVSVFDSVDGMFNSKVNIIDITQDDATQEFTKEYHNSLIYSLDSLDTSTFSVIKSNGIDFIDWDEYTFKNHNNDYNIWLYRNCNSNVVTVFRRENDKNDNNIIIFSKDGEIEHTIKYNGMINDIRVKGSSIYCIDDYQVIVMDFNGKVIRKVEYGYSADGLSVTSTDSVAVIFDDEIKKIKLDD